MANIQRTLQSSAKLRSVFSLGGYFSVPRISSCTHFHDDGKQEKDEQSGNASRSAADCGVGLLACA